MTSPLVSVIIPAYNHEKYIIECLSSVVEQDYRRTQIIFIDDGSRDSTAAKAETFLQKFAPSSICVRKRNSGAANTINIGIRLSHGSFINILNSDDSFGRHRISTCVDFALRSGKQFIYTGVNFIDSDSQPAAFDEYVKSLILADISSHSYPTIGFALMRNQLAISTGNFFFSRDLYSKVGDFRNYLYVHDWDFILRSLFFEEPAKIEENLYNYRLHGTNSFKGLEDIAGYETTEVMSNFIWSMVSRYPVNHRAPSPKYWPCIFERFMEEWNYQRFLPPRFQTRTVEEGALE